MKVIEKWWMVLLLECTMALRGVVHAFRPSSILVSGGRSMTLPGSLPRQRRRRSSDTSIVFPIRRTEGWKLYVNMESSSRTIGPGSHVSEMEVKKSRFLGYAMHVENWKEASMYIDQVKAEHPKARHWCYGFQCGINPISERCSDDGEPTGTAGLPILGAIKGEELSDVVCVVVRYFGGVKLGAGGLIRAYGAAARQVLREAPVDILIPKSSFRVSVRLEHVGALYDSVAKGSASTTAEEYGTDGSLSVTVTSDLSVTEQLRQGLMDATRGAVIFLDTET